MICFTECKPLLNTLPVSFLKQVTKNIVDCSPVNIQEMYKQKLHTYHAHVIISVVRVYCVIKLFSFQGAIFELVCTYEQLKKLTEMMQ